MFRSFRVSGKDEDGRAVVVAVEATVVVPCQDSQGKEILFAGHFFGRGSGQETMFRKQREQGCVFLAGKRVHRVDERPGLRSFKNGLARHLVWFRNAADDKRTLIKSQVTIPKSAHRRHERRNSPRTGALRGAAAGLVATVPAQAAEVGSSNIVGYSKVSTIAGLNLIGVQFQAVGANGLPDLNATMAPSGLVGFDWENAEGGDQLYVWDSANQYYATIYTYAGDSVPAEITTALGYDLSGKWMDNDMLPIDEPPALGDGLWIESTAASAEIVVSGEVNTNSVTKTIVPGLNLVANPFPKALNVNDATYAGLVGFDWENGEGGDQLYVWKQDEQYYATIYTYAGDSVPAEITTALGYDLSGKWMDNDMLPVEVPIPINGAVWIESTALNGSVTFTY